MAFDFVQLEANLSRLQEEKKIAGMAIAVTDRNAILWEQGFGVTSVEKPWDKVTPKTLSRIASNTKFTVGLCVMQLMEQGRIDLDVPINAYIPWFKVSSGGQTEQITFRRLLSHTAGMPKEYTPDGILDEEYFERELKAELEDLQLLWDPAENRSCYSNYGVRLAACAMQRITGRKFSELCEEMVLRPLGMETSTFDLRKAATYEMALPHQKNDDGLPYVEHMIHMNAARYAAGGLYSNVHEMTALARVILNDGKPLVTEDSWSQMTARYAKMDDRLQGDYGLTLMMRPYCGKVLLGHTGSNPPYYSCIWTDADTGLGITFVINTEGGQKFTNFYVPELFATGGKACSDSRQDR